ncbi:MAG TPA: DNA-processing protein DprA [Trebonia sp.]|nr:DNA-processing protein DprA [Trebonia sp.]
MSARHQMSAADDGERVARAALTYLAEPGDPWLAAAVRRHGAPRAVAAIKEGRFPASATVTDAAARALRRWRLRLAEIPQADDLTRLAGRGYRLLCPADSLWPTGLADLADGEPYALWVRGALTDLATVAQRSLAIVGSRAATAYGSYVAAEIAASVAGRGWAVISGGAYGIDGCAHRGALSASGVTLAVMACGVDRPYPAGHKDLLDAVAATGAVISEWPPGRPTGRLRFLVRNRVIAAMTSGTLVVEAGRRSGALNTARHAAGLGRPLMAVPGPVTSDLSAGCHSIIRDWAGTLVTDADEVIERLSANGQDGQNGRDPMVRPPGPVPDAVPAATSPRSHRGRADLARDALDQAAATVLDALPARGAGMPTSDIAVRAGLEPKLVLAKLALLRVYDLAERTDHGWRASRG